MVFSSIAFLVAFLPLTVLLERVMPTRSAKNALLIAASLVFYAYGEPTLVVLMLASTVCNYLFGRLVVPGLARRRAWMVVAVIANLGMLGLFKYADMLVSTANAILGLSVPLPGLPLPLGISFYTFQALSYVIDVYRGDVACQRSYPRVLLYICFFPQLVAGPIVKYHDFADQMDTAHADLSDVGAGLRRFALGLAKKVLLANTMATCADALFALEGPSLCAPAAWLAALAYLMEIYLDFSAYSDMAIGLAAAFGFTLQENFEHPYAATTLREFWRRWHISLSTWFLTYLYIPLGGNRRGAARSDLNRLIVFVLCGLWHGANWTFVVWGLMHGLGMLAERRANPDRVPKWVSHALTLLFVMLAFVVFRSDTLGLALAHWKAMLVGWDLSRTNLAPCLSQLTPTFLLALSIGVLISGSVPERASALMRRGRLWGVLDALGYVASLALVALCVATLAGGTYNPFIYFRF